MGDPLRAARQHLVAEASTVAETPPAEADTNSPQRDRARTDLADLDVAIVIATKGRSAAAAGRQRHQAQARRIAHPHQQADEYVPTHQSIQPDL